MSIAVFTIGGTAGFLLAALRRVAVRPARAAAFVFSAGAFFFAAGRRFTAAFDFLFTDGIGYLTNEEPVFVLSS
jgi:hypothetical protein